MLKEKVNEIRSYLVSEGIQKDSEGDGFSYIGLPDFLPSLIKKEQELGLFSKITFTVKEIAGQPLRFAELLIEELETGETEMFSCEFLYSNAHADIIQNIGSTHTYMRRYLYFLAYNIVESDKIDGKKEVKQAKPTAQNETININISAPSEKERKVKELKEKVKTIEDSKQKQEILALEDLSEAEKEIIFPLPEDFAELNRRFRKIFKGNLVEAKSFIESIGFQQANQIPKGRFEEVMLKAFAFVKNGK